MIELRGSNDSRVTITFSYGNCMSNILSAAGYEIRLGVTNCAFLPSNAKGEGKVAVKAFLGNKTTQS